MTGTPGSGKSLDMAFRIYCNVRTGKKVVANFDMDVSKLKNGRELFEQVENEELTPERLVQISKAYFADHKYGEGRLKLYIDESQVLFNSRNWNDGKRPAWIKFFTQHRKLGYDVYLVAQFDMMLDKQLRALVEYQLIHRKLNQVGWVGALASLLFLGHPVVVCVTYWYPMKQRLRAEWTIGGKYLYRLYDTNKVFDDSFYKS